MTHDRDILGEIDRDEQWLADHLRRTPLPPPTTIAHVRQAVAVELEAEWTDRFDDPMPSQATLERVRGTVRQELDRSRRRRGSPRTWRIFGAVSAAASFLLAALFVRFLVIPMRPDAPPTTMQEQPAPTVLAEAALRQEVLNDMTTAFQTVWKERDAALTILADDIDRLVTPSLDSELDPADAELRAIGDEIHQLFSEETTAQET